MNNLIYYNFSVPNNAQDLCHYSQLWKILLFRQVEVSLGQVEVPLGQVEVPLGQVEVPLGQVEVPLLVRVPVVDLRLLGRFDL